MRAESRPRYDQLLANVPGEIRLSLLQETWIEVLAPGLGRFAEQLNPPPGGAPVAIPNLTVFHEEANPEAGARSKPRHQPGLVVDR